MPSLTFEALRDQLSSLEVPVGEARQLIWVSSERLGAALTAGGAFEIFLAGPELIAASPLVARHLQYDRWEPRGGGASFAASRVLLGSAAHLAAVAALIAIELARLDLSSDESMQAAFSRVEPIIELAIRRGALSTEVLLGLIAELHVLRVALLAAPRARRAATLLYWRGWSQGRDFELGRHSIEVKATLGSVSRHPFSGIHQLEARPLPDGGLETLHLMSFGLVVVENGGQNLPELVDDLVAILDEGSKEGLSARGQLLAMIRQYGGSNSPGYDHETMQELRVYQARHAITFARLYAVDDPAMRLLARSMVDETFAVPDSVTFELELPAKVSAFNPAISWQAEIAAMAASCVAANTAERS